MKVREKLSLQFTLMLAVLLLVVLAAIYLLVARYRGNSFFEKLDSRAVTIAQFYLAEDNLSKDNFQNVVKQFPQSLTGETIRIYTDQFKPRFIPEDTIKWPREVLQKVVSQKKLHLTKGNLQTTGIYYVDNSGNFIIMISAIDEPGFKYLNDLRLVMGFFYLVSLLITFFLGRIFSMIALAPIVSITNNLKRVRSSSLDQRLSVDTAKHDEIDSLSLTINQLLEHLQQSFESQQYFIANASHELRTPITTIMGEAEVALISRRSEEEYRAVLGVVVKEADRLSQIIQSLMELIQTSATPANFQDVRIDELIVEIAAEYENGLVKTDYMQPANPRRMMLQGNSQLLFMALNNIIKNGLKFSGNKPVYCQVYSDAVGIHIIIKDAGIGIAEKDLPNLFQPFYRAHNAIGYAGSGIGLSLTNRIVKLHNGSISIQSKLGGGTSFHITFPV